MRRQNIFVLFGFVFLAILGLTIATSSPSPSGSPSKAPTASKTEVEAPVTNDHIGTTDDDAAASPGDGDVAVAGPLGSDSSYSINGPSGYADSANSGVTAFGVSVVVIGATSIVGSFLLF